MKDQWQKHIQATFKKMNPQLKVKELLQNYHLKVGVIEPIMLNGVI